MSKTPLSDLIPTPQRVRLTGGEWFVGTTDALTVGVHSVSAEPLACWLMHHLREGCGLPAVSAERPVTADIHIGLVGDVIGAGLADAAAADATAFATPCGHEQGYLLDLRPGGIVLAAQELPGLQHAAATLMQVLRGVRPAGSVPCACIEDWPDVRFRVADWLLNAEINRWGLERGDGMPALAARMRRQLDLAARLKLNVVWFDGFGWAADRTPWYAGFVRRLAAYARERHIRLAHAGYGGGYGFAYQKHFIYDSPYYGRISENRVTYPDGPSYDCVGHPRYAASWRFGTCLSNQALAERKLAELTGFVRQCQPGMLYIHDIDTGNFDLAADGWRRRCPACRTRWPDDAMVSATGGAAAYAHWYRQVATAINGVTAEDGTYAAGRDCEIVFVGPVYTAASDTAAVWQQECDYFALVSTLMGPFPNVQFGIREQVVSTAEGGSRTALLRQRLTRTGHGHGVLVVAFAGGDNYFSDTLVPAGAALQGQYAGADTTYTKNLGAVVEPAQAVCAEYGWNGKASGTLAVPRDHGAALDLLSRCQKGQVVPTPWGEPDGPVVRACTLLYGAAAADSMAELVTLGMTDGVTPVVTGWGAVSREVAVLLASTPVPADAADRPARWRRRAQGTSRALALLAQVLEGPLPDPTTRCDLLWLQTRLEVGRRFSDLVACVWQWRLASTTPEAAAARAALAEVEQCLRERVGQETVDPVGGDVAVWYAMAARLRAALS